MPYGYGTRNTATAVSGTSTEVLPARWGKRSAFSITCVTAGVRISIFKGEDPAVLDQGLTKQTFDPFVESTDAGFQCWQGPIQVIASGAGSVAVSETLTPVKQ